MRRGGVFKSGFVPKRKSAQTTRICRTGGHQPFQQCLRTGCVAAKRKKPRVLAWSRVGALHLRGSRHHVHRSSRCASSKARARAVSTAACLAVETERPRRQRRRVSTRHQSLEAAGYIKNVPRRATISPLYGGAAAQGARPGPGRISGRAARGKPGTRHLPRDVGRRISAVAEGRWRGPQGRHSRIAAAPTPAWYQRRSHRALSPFPSLCWQIACREKLSRSHYISKRCRVWRNRVRLALPRPK